MRGIMPNKFNTTQLYIDRAEERGIVHRDYLAHCLRWTHIIRNAKVGQTILDVGCGTNTPLAWAMYTNKFKPRMYVGVDVRPNFETDPEKFNFPCKLIGRFDATNPSQWAHPALVEYFDLITCLEVLEHMEKEDGLKLLENLSTIISGGGTLYLSTPCFNGSAAANHIYEWRYEELKDTLDSLFKIESHFGTFASQRDIIPHATVEERKVFEMLRGYYDSNLLAVILAPLYPQYSRNCMWRLRSR